MSFEGLIDFFPGYVSLPNWGPNPFGENSRDINGYATGDQQPRLPSDLHILGENDLMPPLMPHMPIPHVPGSDNIFVSLPMLHRRQHDNLVESPLDVHVDDNTFVAVPMPHAPSRLALSPIDIHRESDDNDESDNFDDSDSDSDRTVSGWELDQEFVGLDYNDDSEVEENATSAPQAPRTVKNMDGAGSSPSDAESIDDINVATMAPYAPRDLRTYNESVGEILTHDSWRRIIAGIPPGIPLPGEEQRDRYADRAVYFEGNNIERPGQAQPETDYDSTEASSQAESEAEEDIYGAPPPPAALEDPNDSDFDYHRAEAENDGYRSLEDADDVDEDDDPLAGIPLPREDSDDDDFRPRDKRAPRRKALSMSSTFARKQAKKALELARIGAGNTCAPSGQSAQLPRPKASVASAHGGAASHVAIASQTPGPTAQRIAPANPVPSHEASDEEDVPPESVEDRAKLLQNAVTELHGEVTLAEARYEEAANNPRALTDPRTKKRRMAKLMEFREQLRKAREKQKRFQERYGLAQSQHEGGMEAMASAGAATIASSSSTASASIIPSRIKVLKQEVHMWQGTIQDLRRKVAHCQAQVADVEAHPEKFLTKRAGFKQGRLTRLGNAEHNLSHNLRMLEDKRRLLDEERRRVRGVDTSEGQAEQHEEQQELDQEAKVPAVKGLQSPALQSSTLKKRKTSDMNNDEMEEEEEEETIHVRSKPRLMLGTPV